MQREGDVGVCRGDASERLGARVRAGVDERHALLDRLARIQRSISVGAPLQEVLDSITAGAHELLDEPVVGLRLLDPARPGGVRIASSVGLSAEERDHVGESLIGEGAGGRAILENQLVVIEDYTAAEGTIEHFASAGLQSAMAAPVHDRGEVVGSLVVATYARERRYSATEREMLLAFAEHISLALTDARIIAERERLAGRHAEERYRRIVDTTNEGVWMLDAEDRTVFVNETLERMLGIAAADLLGRPPWEIMQGEAAEDVRAALARRRAGVREHYELTLRHADGGLVHAIVSASPLHDADGNYDGAVAMMTDVTPLIEAGEERARLEERLQRAQSLEDIGTLAGQIAHDFNNVLGVILSFAFVATEAARAGRAPVHELERIREAAEHGSALTSQLLTFSRRDAGVPEDLVAGDLVASAVELSRARATAGVELATELEAADLRVRIDPTHLRQVVLNLVDNALDATPQGHVTVSVRARDVGEADAALRLRPGVHVSLVVRDTGTGMEPEVAARAVEPMFTTKPRGQGTGFGLAIVRSIAEQAGGALELRSVPGEGTEVEILLPSAAAPAAPAATAGGERILLVEDDDAVRALTSRLLAADGHDVVEARTAAHARDLDAADEFGLIVTENGLPDASGIELLNALRAFRGGTPAIVMAGYVGDATAAGTAAPEVTWLQKPFGASALRAAIAHARARAVA